MSVNTFLGKDIDQYVIGKESLEGECSVSGQIKDTLVTLKLSGIATSLPTHSILYGETDDHYNVHISDNKGNVKPVYYETNKIDDLKNIDLTEINRKITRLNTSHNNLSTHVTEINTALTNKDTILSANITSLNTKIDNLHRVARTGKYTDLENTPEIPTKFKTINNESILGTGNITVSVDSGERNVINEIQINGDAVQPDSNRVVDIQLKTINDTSIVGLGNIPLKTINNESLVGTGNITLEGGGSSIEPDLSGFVKTIYVQTENGRYGPYEPDNYYNNGEVTIDLSDSLRDLIDKVNELYNLAHPTDENSLKLYTKRATKPNTPSFNGYWQDTTISKQDQQGVTWVNTPAMARALSSDNNLKLWKSISVTKSDSDWYNFTSPIEYQGEDE